MTVCNIRRAVTSAKYSWSRLAAMTAGLLLATVCTGGSAFAADDCGAKPAHHSASTQCLEHRLRTGVHGASKTQKTARTKAGESASPSDGDELTPASAAVSFTAVVAPPWAAPTAEHVGLSSMTLPASRTVHRLGRGGEGWPPSADSLVAAGTLVGGRRPPRRAPRAGRPRPRRRHAPRAGPVRMGDPAARPLWTDRHRPSARGRPGPGMGDVVTTVSGGPIGGRSPGRRSRRPRPVRRGARPALAPRPLRARRRRRPLRLVERVPNQNLRQDKEPERQSESIKTGALDRVVRPAGRKRRSRALNRRPGRLLPKTAEPGPRGPNQDRVLDVPRIRLSI